MNDKPKPLVFDADNPEWTEADIVRARTATEVLSPEVLAAFGKGKRDRSDDHR